MQLGYDEPLAHLIEAGADMFLMPSRFEPCGLNQMYSQRYGTPPVVRATGGLADTIVDATPASLADGTCDRFLFAEETPVALLAAIERAIDLYREPKEWRQIQRAGMTTDFSWGAAARRVRRGVRGPSTGSSAPRDLIPRECGGRRVTLSPRTLYTRNRHGAPPYDSRLRVEEALEGLLRVPSHHQERHGQAGASSACWRRAATSRPPTSSAAPLRCRPDRAARCRAQYQRLLRERLPWRVFLVEHRFFVALHRGRDTLHATPVDFPAGEPGARLVTVAPVVTATCYFLDAAGKIRRSWNGCSSAAVKIADIPVDGSPSLAGPSRSTRDLDIDFTDAALVWLAEILGAYRS